MHVNNFQSLSWIKIKKYPFFHPIIKKIRSAFNLIYILFLDHVNQCLNKSDYEI